ncbi:MAG: L-threonylcarbamoyladenylate synthase [Chitinophagales bacterium]|jgi:L-threonylcarbamoyladenylate synthase
MIMEEDLKQAAEAILNGGVILCPTDTIWGLSADARNQEAVNKVYELKNRPTNKSMIILVSDLEMLKDYVYEIPQKALTIIAEATQPTSIIYPKGKQLAANTMSSNGSIAIRIVQDSFCKQLIQNLGFPIVSSSANLSGESNPTMFTEISSALMEKADFVVEYSRDSKETHAASSIFIIDGQETRQIR